jgi:hypothetical protein
MWKPKLGNSREFYREFYIDWSEWDDDHLDWDNRFHLTLPVSLIAPRFAPRKELAHFILIACNTDLLQAHLASTRQ